MVNHFVEIKRNSINEVNNGEEKEGFWHSKDIKYSLSDALKFMFLFFNCNKQRLSEFEPNYANTSELFRKDKEQLLKEMEIANIINSIKELKTITKFIYQKSIAQEEKYSKDIVLNSNFVNKIDDN